MENAGILTQRNGMRNADEDGRRDRRVERATCCM